MKRRNGSESSDGNCRNEIIIIWQAPRLTGGGINSDDAIISRRIDRWQDSMVDGDREGAIATEGGVANGDRNVIIYVRFSGELI